MADTEQAPQEQEPEKRKVGRPSEYNPDYCQQVKDFCAKGLSLTAFAGEIEVARSTIGDWMAAHPEFALACKVAIAKRAAFHERRMNEREATGPMVTASRFSLVNCTLKDEPKDWSEKVTNEHTGPNGEKLEITQITWHVADPKSQSEDSPEAASTAAASAVQGS